MTTTTTTGIIHNEQQNHNHHHQQQQLEKQIQRNMGGCMAGFFNLFDRNHVFSSPHNKRLPGANHSSSSSAGDSTSESVSSAGSPSSRSTEFVVDHDNKPPQLTPTSRSDLSSPAADKPAETHPRTPPHPVGGSSAKSPSPLPAVNDGGGAREKATSTSTTSSPSPWKFAREAPRLSLDSRAVVDAKGKLHPREIRTTANSNRRQSSVGCVEYGDDDDDEESERHRRSPSVVARLMGLEPTPSSSHHHQYGSPALADCKMAELRRSASESRSRDLLLTRFVDGSNFSLQQLRDTSNGGGGGGGSGVVAVDGIHRSKFTNSGFNARTFNNNNNNSYGELNTRRSSSVPPPAPARHNNGYRRPSSPPPQLSNHHHPHQTMTRKGFYDTTDFFPDPKQHQPPTSTICGEIEKRLRMRGIDDSSRDLETLKQILEALQIKGLLHHHSTAAATTKLPSPGGGPRTNFAYETQRRRVEPPFKPAGAGNSRSPADGLRGARTAAAALVTRGRNLNSAGGDTVASPRREGATRSPARTTSSPGRSEKGAAAAPAMRRNSNSSSSKGVSGEMQRRVNGTTTTTMEQRRGRGGGGGSSPVQSPRMVGVVGSRRMDQTVNNNSSSNKSSAGRDSRRMIRDEDESSTTVSESSCFSTSTDTEGQRSKMEEYKEGRSLLERCDKLLNSIAEMNASAMNKNKNINSSINNNNNGSGELQPSPVSVLDSSFYKEEEEEEGESTSPGAVAKRTIFFKDQQVVEVDEEAWSPSSTIPPPPTFPPKSSDSTEDDEDPDLTYISEILRASTYLPSHSYSDLFLLLEKRQSQKVKDVTPSNSNNNNKLSRLHRRLLFDATTEILDRNRHLPPWTPPRQSSSWQDPAREIWSEIGRIRAKDGSADDLFEVICGVMRRDMAGDSIEGWGGCHVEVSEAVLDIERQIFKDLIGETIRDLAADAAAACSQRGGHVLRRKLVF